MQLFLSDEQLQIVQNIVSALIGAGGGFAAQWVNTRRTKSQVANDNTKVMTDSTKVITEAASEHVKNAQTLVSMFQGMLDEREEHFKSEIEIAKASCAEQIFKLREEYTSIISDMEARMITLTEEKRMLSHEVTRLTLNRDIQEQQVKNLMESLLLKMARYEDDLSNQKKEKNNQSKDVVLEEFSE